MDLIKNLAAALVVSLGACTGESATSTADAKVDDSGLRVEYSNDEGGATEPDSIEAIQCDIKYLVGIIGGGAAPLFEEVDELLINSEVCSENVEYSQILNEFVNVVVRRRCIEWSTHMCQGGDYDLYSRYIESPITDAFEPKDLVTCLSKTNKNCGSIQLISERLSN